jgi:hypothetical protein
MTQTEAGVLCAVPHHTYSVADQRFAKEILRRDEEKLKVNGRVNRHKFVW